MEYKLRFKRIMSCVQVVSSCYHPQKPIVGPIGLSVGLDAELPMKLRSALGISNCVFPKAIDQPVQLPENWQPDERAAN